MDGAVTGQGTQDAGAAVVRTGVATGPQDMGPGVSVLVVSYNTREMTLACLRSLAAETRTPHEVIVVDNASDDGSAEAIAAEFPGIALIRPGANLGFARANNLAAARARGAHLLLLNPDTVVLDGAVDRLLTLARTHPEAGIWGGRTVFADGRLNPASARAEFSLWSLFCQAVGLARLFPHSPRFNTEDYGGWARDTVRRVDVVSGCFLLIPRALWERLGGFDPRFAMYGEETDLCMRARAQGARPLVTPEAVIVHHGGASERVRADKLVRLLAAKVTLMDKHWSAPRAAAGRVLFRLMVLVRRAAGGPDRASAWAEVWRRRREWLPGFPPAQG